MVDPDSSSTTRVFINLDSPLEAHYKLSSVFSSAVDVRLKCSIVIIPTSNMGIFGNSANSDSYIRISSSSQIRAQSASGGNYLTGTSIGDGRLHSIDFVGTTTTGELFVDGVSQGQQLGDFSQFDIDVIGDYLGDNDRFFDGIISGAAVETQGNIESWSLSEPISNTEQSHQGGSQISYENISTSERELYQLSEDGTQWDNISPAPQELQAIIEIA